MKVNGTYQIEAHPSAVWASLLDTVCLANCIPGCKQLEEIGPNQYKAQLEVGIASIKGVYEGRVRMLDLDTPSQLKMRVEGRGNRGHLNGMGEIHLAASQGGTRINYDGQVEIGGLVASVGQRMLAIAARRLIQRFFDNLNEALH